MNRAGDAVTIGRPAEIKRFTAEHVERGEAEIWDAAVYALSEIIADDVKRTFGNFSRFEHRGGVTAESVLNADDISTCFGWLKRLAVDENGAAGTGCNEISGEPDDALDEENIGRRESQHHKVATLRRIQVVGPRVRDDAVPCTNGGAHRGGRHLVSVKARFVHGVLGRGSQGAKDDDDSNERIREPGERNGRLWLLRGCGRAGRFDGDEELPGEDDEDRRDHRPETEEQARVCDERSENVRDYGDAERLARLTIVKLTHAWEEQAE